MYSCNFNNRARVTSLIKIFFPSYETYPSRTVTDLNDVSFDQLYKSYLIRVIVEPLAIHVPRQLCRWPWTDCHADDVVFPIRAEGRVFAAEYHHAQGPHWNTEEDRGRSQEWTTWIARGRWWTPDQKARTRIAAAAELRCLERPRTCTVRPLPNAF